MIVTVDGVKYLVRWKHDPAEPDRVRSVGSSHCGISRLDGDGNPNRAGFRCGPVLPQGPVLEGEWSQGFAHKGPAKPSAYPRVAPEVLGSLPRPRHAESLMPFERYIVDLYCGLGGWAEGFLAEDFTVIGFDIERPTVHDYPGLLVVQDVLTLHGSQFRHAAGIVASPPCQEPSYLAMPWSRAKALNAAGPPVKFIELFEACFRIQREASEAAGRHIPMIVENVVGAQRWVGRAQWHYGSYYLWGDVPGLMPLTFKPPLKGHGNTLFGIQSNGDRYDQRQQNPVRGHHLKTIDRINKRDGHGHTRHLTNPAEHGVGDEQAGVKIYAEPNSGRDWFDYGPAAHWSGTSARKVASALIAKIPYPLARHIAQCWAS